MKTLEKENTRLRHVVAELSLEKQILKDAAKGNFYNRCAVEHRSPAVWSIRAACMPAVGAVERDAAIRTTTQRDDWKMR